MGYNGWTNRATWCAALWLGNDEPLYRAVRAGADPMELLLAHAGFREDLGILDDALILHAVDADELRECVEELRA
jgi:hypothetical protein